jgi:preprotein translocase subunit SecY
MPTVMASELKVPFYFGGTSLLILVGVALDFVQQVQAHLLSSKYDGLMKTNKIRGRRVQY